MHVLGVAMVIAYTFVVSYILYWVTDKMVNMRVNVKHEQLGLDRSQHGESYGILYEDEEHEIREVAMGNQAHAK
jgi:Amt family ammonium transporter